MTSVFQGLSLSRSVGRVGENPGNEVAFDPNTVSKNFCLRKSSYMCFFLTCGLRVTLGTSYCGHCDMQMCHSGVDGFIISRFSVKASDMKTTAVVER